MVATLNPRRRSSIAFTLLAAALTAAACGGSDEGSADGPAEITFSNWQFTEPGRGEAFEALVADFNAAQDDVEVTPVSIPFPDYEETIFTQLGAGSGPDVMVMMDAPFFQAREAGFLADLAPVLDRDADELTPVAEIAVDGDARHGVPWEVVDYALIVNTDLLEAASADIPTDAEGLLAAATAVRASGEVYGLGIRHTMPEEGGWWYDLSNLVYGMGGAWTNDDGEPTVDSPEVREAVQLFVDLVLSDAVPRGADAATYRRMFWEGQLAMMIDNSTVPSSMINENPAIADSIATAPIPLPEPEHGISLALLGVNAASEHQDGAAAFVNWLLSDDVQAQLAEIMVGSSVATGAAPPQELLAERPWVQTYLDVAEFGRSVAPTGAETDTAQIRTIVLTNVDRVVNGQTDVETALADAQTELESLLEQ